MNLRVLLIVVLFLALLHTLAQAKALAIPASELNPVDVVQVPPRQVITSKVFSYDGHVIATVRSPADDHGHSMFKPGILQLWDTKTGTFLWTADALVGSACTFSPDDKTVAATKDDGWLGLWDTTNGQLKYTLPCPVQGPYREIDSAAFSKDGKFLAIGGCGYEGYDKAILFNAGSNAPGFVGIWDVQTGALLRVLKGQQGATLAVAFSPDNSMVCGGSYDGFAEIWNVQTGAVLHRLPFNKGTASVSAVAFSPDGKTLATGNSVYGRDIQTTGEIRLWNPQTGNLRKLLSDLGPMYKIGSIPSLTFSSDGTTLASAGPGRSLILWDIPVGSPKGMISEFPEPPGHEIARFIPQGLEFATETEDGRLQISVWRGK